ncbi:hypothetical protein ABZ468_48805 [Streptomyces sp. NPDC005708]|uniref:hypothetical protein n=1 Tax=Streptomyces sp. NPDC005708 TaxID=3154564 RepID=UPI003411A2A7
MLILADERGLHPSLPHRIVAEREAARDAAAERDRLAAAKLEGALRIWSELGKSAPAQLTVHENTQHTGPNGSLRHVTPPVDLISGRTRRHKAGMGLCETPDRVKPLRLGAAVEGPLVTWSP